VAVVVLLSSSTLQTSSLVLSLVLLF
jgi:hypothetical protein